MLSALLLSIALVAQGPLTVSGRVVTGTPSVPVVGARISVGSTTAMSDRDGRFSVTVARLDSPAAIQVTVRAPGYLDTTVEVAPDGALVTIVLQPTLRVNEDVEVTGDAARIEDPVSKIEVTPAVVRSVAG